MLFGISYRDPMNLSKIGKLLRKNWYIFDKR